MNSSVVKSSIEMGKYKKYWLNVSTVAFITSTEFPAKYMHNLCIILVNVPEWIQSSTKLKEPAELPG